MFKDLFEGGQYVIRGINLFYRDSRAWLYALPPVILVLLIYIGIGWCSFYFISFIPSPDFLPAWAGETIRGILYVFAAISVFLAAPFFTMSAFYELFGALFFDLLTEYWEKKHHNYHPKHKFTEFISFAFESFCFAGISTVLIAVCFILGFFLPVVGQILIFWMMSETMGTAILGCSSFNHHMKLRELVQKSSSNWCIKGFYLACYGLSLIPFGSVLFLPGMVIGGVELFNHELKDQLTNDHP